MNYKKGFGVIGIIVIIAIVGLVAGGTYVAKKVIDTRGGDSQLYKHYGMSFVYPKDWVISNDSGSSVFLGPSVNLLFHPQGQSMNLENLYDLDLLSSDTQYVLVTINILPTTLTINGSVESLDSSEMFKIIEERGYESNFFSGRLEAFQSEIVSKENFSLQGTGAVRYVFKYPETKVMIDKILRISGPFNFNDLEFSGLNLDEDLFPDSNYYILFSAAYQSPEDSYSSEIMDTFRQSFRDININAGLWEFFEQDVSILDESRQSDRDQGMITNLSYYFASYVEDFYNASDSYKNLCTNGVINLEVDMAIASIAESFVNHKLAEDQTDAGVKCFSSDEEFAVSIILHSGKNYCIDATGFSGEITRPISSTSCQ